MSKNSLAAVKPSAAKSHLNVRSSKPVPRWKLGEPRRFSDYSDRLAAMELPASALTYIESSFEASSREVGEGGARSVRGRFPSRKLGQFIKFESHTCEALYVLHQEMDPKSHAVLDQPQSVPIERVLPSGKRHVATYTPDYLNICDGIRVIECKPRDALVDLMLERPEDWLVGEDGVSFIPAVRAFGRLGMVHETFVPDRRYQVLHANLFFLASFVAEELNDDEIRVLERIQLQIAEAPRSISSLCHGNRKLTPRLLVRGVAHGLLHAALKATLLRATENAYLFGSAGEASAMSEAAMRLAFQAQCESSTSSCVMREVSPRAYSFAQQAMTTYLQRRMESLPLSATDRKYLSRQQDTRAKGLPDVMAFIPDFAGRGNTERRLSKEQITEINTQLKNALLRECPGTIADAHGAANEALSKIGEPEVSYETVRQAARALSKKEIADAQGGLRAANAARPVSDPRLRSLPPQTAGEIVHFDSTPQDNRQLVQLGEITGVDRPNIIAAFCAATAFCLGFAITFGAASRFGFALLMRDMIRRWGFVPPWIMSDRGSEFINSYREQVYSAYNVGPLERPSGDPAFGQVVEHGLRQVNHGLLRKFRGSTRNDEAGRSADGKTKSRSNAAFWHHQIRAEIESYFMDSYANSPQGERDDSPAAQWAAQRPEFSVGRAADINEEDVLITTAVSVYKGRVRPNAQRGVTVGYRRYFSPTFHERARTQWMHEIRLDPEFPDRAYVLFDRGWVVVFSHDHASLQQCNSEEMLFEGLRLSLNSKENRRLRSKTAQKQNQRIDDLNRSAAGVAKQAAQSTAAPQVNDHNSVVADPWAEEFDYDKLATSEET